ncbi:Leucine-rich repeat and calponin y domain-containing protein 2 [Liparis tanakae]|uniref:Leucine-rich repeat and calponin y domain-containing protein 2 n=1 Tax=Liparis tanakae TaxID=230148 RepID=A0A4Z2E529_9TELE|nr:Leucine-rich repeat and calponin y domain-containing protein 2 [Liparis tanakae]
MELTGPSHPHAWSSCVLSWGTSSFSLVSSTTHPLCAFCASQICLKGKVHIFKYLNIQACRTDKKPDTLDLPSLGKRCLPQPLTDSLHSQVSETARADALSLLSKMDSVKGYRK